MRNVQIIFREIRRASFIKIKFYILIASGYVKFSDNSQIFKLIVGKFYFKFFSTKSLILFAAAYALSAISHVKDSIGKLSG